MEYKNRNESPLSPSVEYVELNKAKSIKRQQDDVITEARGTSRVDLENKLDDRRLEAEKAEVWE